MSGAPDSLLLRGAATFDGRARSILMSGDRILAVGADADAAAHGARVLDARGLIGAPGLIDLQVNGAAGLDITSDPASVWSVGAALARFGVTAFLPTIVSSRPETVVAAQAALAAGPPADFRGAYPMGLHLEGPFLNPERRGVHDPAQLRLPDTRLIAGWSRQAGIRLVTLAPELPGALELVRELSKRGIVVSAGHTAATFAEARAAIDAGVTYATHLFNAMVPLDHRAPGVIAAVLADERMTIGIIVDGIHVHPAVVSLAWRIVGAGRFSAVTDAIAGLGMPNGASSLAGAPVEVGPAGAMSGGRLAGGVLGLDVMVRNLVAFCGASIEDAVGSATSVPARLLGLSAERGSLSPGARADITLVTTELEVAATIVGGRVVHSDSEHVGWA